MNENKPEGFEERAIPDEPIHSRRRTDQWYGQFIGNGIRVQSVFKRADVRCFECEDAGQLPGPAGAEQKRCPFCTVGIGEYITVPSWSNDMYRVTGIGPDRLLSIRRICHCGVPDVETRIICARETVKVIFKLVDENHPDDVIHYAESYESVMDYARTEGLVEHFGDGATCLSGRHDIQVVDGTEDF